MTPNLTATTFEPSRHVPEPDTSTEHPARRASRAAHPAGTARAAGTTRPAGTTHPAGTTRPTDRRPETAEVALRPASEDGSLVTEYGLLAVVAATVAGVVIQWASGGALVTLFNALLRHARSLVGA
ncbi:MAG: hypothetical protein ACNA8R_08415 [Nitriliruptoraceae bacterium]